MPYPLITTKLNIPAPRAETVIRKRLFDSLNAGLKRKLCFISAPAGFGKTTLVSSWLGQHEYPAAWISLDPGDNNTLAIFTAIVASLRHLEPEILHRLWNMLQSPQPPTREVLLANLINDLDNLTEDTILVLDDYHCIDSTDVNEGLAFFLDNLPPRLHLVICSRQELPISISNLRARDELVEIEVQDLRFSEDESEAFLNRTMGLQLIQEDLVRLNTHTEGWAVGLQLTALSIRSQKDADQVISELSGDSRYIADYLVDEVLSKLSERIHMFLLRTSILDRFSAPLCDALTGSRDSREIIETLERLNLFIFPLDAKHSWYRYHHLFRELLIHRLQIGYSELLPELYLRASLWHEKQGLFTDAVRYTLEGRDFQRTADLLEASSELMTMQGRWNIMLDWYDKLPAEVIAARPKLWGSYVWTLINTDLNKADKARLWLQLDQIHELPLSKQDGKRVRGEIAVVRAALAIHYYADARKAQQLTSEGMDCLEEYHSKGYSAAVMNYGYASLQLGELDNARQASETALDLCRQAGSSQVALFAMINLAEVTALEGNLSVAENLYQEAIQFANRFGLQEGDVFSKAYTGLSSLYYEWNRLEEALYYLKEGLRLAERNSYIDFLIPAYIKLARIQCNLGEFEAAYKTCQLAEALCRKRKNPPLIVEQVEAMRTMIWFAQGKTQLVLHWLDGLGNTYMEEISFVREFELLCAAEALIVKGDFSTAFSVLNRLHALAQLQNRKQSAIKIELMMAKACQLSGDTRKGLEILQKVIQLAEPERYIRLFIDQGEPVRHLLTKLIRSGQAADQWDDILLGYAHHLGKLMDPRSNLSLSIPNPFQGLLMEPLTERELEVLRLVSSGASNQQIADEMVVALSTVKWHLKNIYSKLGAKRRTEALKLAKELQLF